MEIMSQATELMDCEACQFYIVKEEEKVCCASHTGLDQAPSRATELWFRELW